LERLGSALGRAGGIDFGKAAAAADPNDLFVDDKLVADATLSAGDVIGLLAEAFAGPPGNVPTTTDADVESLTVLADLNDQLRQAKESTAVSHLRTALKGHVKQILGFLAGDGHVEPIKCKVYLHSNPEYLVYFNTVLCFPGCADWFSAFEEVLRPEAWPTYNGSFWQAMTPLPEGTEAEYAESPLVLGPEQAKEIYEFLNKTKKSLSDLRGPQGREIFPASNNGKVYREKVGPQEKSDLFPGTFLQFLKPTTHEKNRTLLIYNLVCSRDLEVDNGAIEVKVVGGDVIVTTTKALYVKANNSFLTEEGGVLASGVVNQDWGRHTAELVTSAASSNWYRSTEEEENPHGIGG